MERTAIVTGASRGIGQATALALAAEGFDIAAVAWRDTERLAALVAEVEKLGRRCQSFDCDIGDLAAHAPLLDAVARACGAVHCLVNNAGVSVLRRGDLLDVAADSYDRCFDVNTRGTFFLTQAVARRMVAAPETPAGLHRSIVFVTSSNAVAATPERGEYCMSKIASHMAARLYALRLAASGIAVYEVQPGLILTGMTAPSKEKYDGLIKQGMTATPRWGLPEDVARVIRTMAAGLLPYTVGQEIRVDGGLLISRF
ncbi:3-ketoacyl-ACP reductase [Verminephrobacter eiseniae]|uniref:Short-chain dehydrogenase/reductase SDR n=2 Tax=Verminephrobacter eiseniae TaxID=364317 RepID=A1WG67_VEREI|nr:3-ketoacyl-ACP reductase [Verminephrobacter eiseniae]KAB7635398.1 3-ketoacyl-ACP reductase [Verminephrobacter sp. Larva24]ABM56624.1 short-chain dehydrogenase/reductase SDR [Verminephrobacter eiseniae EF01-2]MCW5233701.1 3-ketoacyl-ACP reductase [Verminephrobacter eiseniae]MCW5261826.1 3-ketoacyl-ACP reductase [Verminephrobacter eiseniae]MCW5286982.1 3-ketoacyl-ACP reductase [Verminephrobacter eiseniae]